MFDVIIIGAGVIGSCVARELSRYNLKIAVLEKEEDVCTGTSKANSGIVHSGVDAKPGTLKAKLNVEGCKKMEALSKELDFSYRKNGSLILCFSDNDRNQLEKLNEQAKINGVEQVRIVQGEELRLLSPNLSNEVVAALYAPNSGIVCPFGLTIAMAENASVNGVSFHMNEEVKAVYKLERGYQIDTDLKSYQTKTIINAAGVYADRFHNMVSEKKQTIIPRKGEYLLLDKKAGTQSDKTIFQLPTNLGKGILVTPTVHGNLLVGPNAMDIQDKEDVRTTIDGLFEVMDKAKKSIPTIPFHQVITSFAGLRAHNVDDDFIIEEVEDAKGFFDVAGIESPGLTSAPAIGEMVSLLVADYLNARKKETFQPVRKGIPQFSQLTILEQRELLSKRPEYGSVVCRCEQITEGEIIDAIHRPLGAKSLDGVKRRCRTGMGRCQAGFCTPRTMEILAREQNIPVSEITKSGNESKLIQSR